MKSLSLFTTVLLAVSLAGCDRQAIKPAAATVDVTRFGAGPDDGGDDTQAFVAAVNEIQSGSARRLLIPPGRYHLTAGGNPKRPDALFPFANLDGLEIEGPGAELMVSGVTSVFNFDSCHKVSIRGLAFDLWRPAFSAGLVTAGNPRFFDVAVEPEYPVRGGEAVPAFMNYDPATRLVLPAFLDNHNCVSSTELLAPQNLRVHLTRGVPPAAGNLVVLRHEIYGKGPVLMFNRCSDVSVSDTTIYSAPGMGLAAVVCENVTLRNFNILKRPGSRHPMTTTADGAHFGGCTGTVHLEDCTFEGMGDDGVNVKSGLYLSVRQRIDDHTLLTRHNMKLVDLPDPADTMEISHEDTLVPFATARVRSAVLEPGVENFIRVTFEGPLPEGLREGDVLGNATRVPALRMRRCTMRDIRPRGVICQTRDVVIEDCTFQRCTGPAVLVFTEVTQFFESIGGRDVMVRRNLVKECNFGSQTFPASLCVMALLKTKGAPHPPQPGVHRGVTFESNRILGSDEGAIFAAGVEGLTIKDNVIEDACRLARQPEGGPAIRVLNCARVDISGNTVDPARQGAHFTKAVLVTPPSPRGLSRE